tara:strand:- start:481 stop:711 length:231 start_codon:yes stop_codon:yes gene_type:complete
MLTYADIDNIQERECVVDEHSDNRDVLETMCKEKKREGERHQRGARSAHTSEIPQLKEVLVVTEREDQSLISEMNS